MAPFQTSCIRRLVVESHALALNDQPSDPQLTSRKLPIAERQTRQAEQETRLEGIIFSPEVTPIYALVDLCVNMLEQNVLTWIKPEECTSRSQEIQSLKKDAKVSLDANGSIKITPQGRINHMLIGIRIRSKECVVSKEIPGHGPGQTVLIQKD